MLRRRWTVWLVLGAGMAESGIDVRAAGTLPAAPREAPVLEDVILHLEIVLNGRATGAIVPVRRNAGRWWLQVRSLRAIGVPVHGAPEDWTEPAALSGVAVVEAEDGLSLQLRVPADWLPIQHVESPRRLARVPAQSSFGMLVNYDAYATFGGPTAASRSIWTELRTFGRFGMLASTGVWRDGMDGSSRFLRYDSQWRRSDPERLLSYEIGDLVTRGVAWSRPVRMAGAQVYRDFSIRPDVITYPLPVFTGEAVLPSMVDLFIDGHRAGGQPLDPGPFQFGGLPGLSGAGEATVVTTDALGRQTSVTLPFYVANDLLAEGLTDFAFAAGWIRRDYGLRGAAYGDPLASASIRHGARDWLTIEAHVEAADTLGMAGMGVAMRLGRFGVLDAAFAQSRWRSRAGSQQVVGYQYRRQSLGFQVSHTRRSAGYADLGVLDASQRAGDSTTVASISLAFREAGSASAGYFDSADRQGQRTRLLNLSWAQPLPAYSSMLFTLNRELSSSSWSMGAQLTVPLGRRAETLNIGLDDRADAGHAQRIQYGRALPSQGGAGWSLAYARAQAQGDLVHADLSWRGRHLQLQSGLYGSLGDPVYWGGAAGSLVVMERKAFLAPRINDAFALIDTQGHAGIPVKYENQPMGTTDRDGFLLVPWASAYYAARYEIDLLAVPLDLQADEIEQQVAIARGSGLRIRFPLRQVAPLQLLLHDRRGQPLPMGARVVIGMGGETFVGWDGQVYIENPPPHLHLRIHLPGGDACEVRLEPPQPPSTTLIGPLTCQ